jgi:uncharacterized membrane protein YwzB
MNVNLSPLQEPMACYTGDHLDALLHGPHNTSAMDLELQKINAHFVHEEVVMKRVITMVGVTLFLALMASLFYLQIIPSSGMLGLLR